jgi:hypothetical protein
MALTPCARRGCRPTHIDSGYWLHQQADLHSRAVHQEDMDLSAGVAVDDVPVFGSATRCFRPRSVPRFGIAFACRNMSPCLPVDLSLTGVDSVNSAGIGVQSTSVCADNVSAAWCARCMAVLRWRADPSINWARVCPICD